MFALVHNKPDANIQSELGKHAKNKYPKSLTYSFFSFSLCIEQKQATLKVALQVALLSYFIPLSCISLIKLPRKYLKNEPYLVNAFWQQLHFLHRLQLQGCALLIQKVIPLQDLPESQTIPTFNMSQSILLSKTSKPV